MKPYVGITGFMNRGQVKGILGSLDGMDWPETHQVMIGVLVSPKSLRGEELKPIWRNKYPAPDQLGSIFVRDPRALNLVHYNSKEPDLADQLERVVELTPNLDGFQLNIVWPDPVELLEFKMRSPELKIVLQLSRKALDGYDRFTEGSRRWLDNRIRPYTGLIDYVLIDLSGGTGIQLDPRYTATALSDMEMLDGMEFGEVVAGGLDARVVPDLIGSLIEEVPWLGWDAEGRLRSEDDQLDLGKCIDYLGVSVEVIRRFIRWYEVEWGCLPKFSA